MKALQTAIMLRNRGYKGINPLVAGTENCEPCHSYRGSRRYYLVHFVLSGRGRFTVNGKTHDLSADDVFLLPPETVCYYVADERDPWTYTWLGFESSDDLTALFSRSKIHLPECRETFLDLMRCSNGDININREMFVLGKIYEFLAVLGVGTDQAAESEYVSVAKNYIETHYYSDIKIADLSREMNLDRTYFSALFKKTVGVSPQEYLISVRLENARRLMCGSGVPPKEAAAMCGYRDIFNFSKMFKKRYGLSPRSYAKEAERVTGG